MFRVPQAINQDFSDRVKGCHLGLGVPGPGRKVGDF